MDQAVDLPEAATELVGEGTALVVAVDCLVVVDHRMVETQTVEAATLAALHHAVRAHYAIVTYHYLWSTVALALFLSGSAWSMTRRSATCHLSSM
jgi:hypothetical protein